MPAISHLFFTHAARAWGSSPELGNGVHLTFRGNWEQENRAGLDKGAEDVV